MQLRSYQQEAINKLRTAFSQGVKHAILCAPTGAGKTVMFCEMVRLAANSGKRVLIVTDRTELLTQSGGALNYHNIKPIEITATNKRPDLNGKVFTAMVETLSRRIKKDGYSNWFKSLDLIIFDEAHKQPFNKLFPYVDSNTYVIGATATPYRDGNQEPLSDFYEKLIEVVKIEELIDLGYLATPKTYGVKIDLKGIKKKGGDYNPNELAAMYESRKIYLGVVKNYRKICNGKKTLAFASTIASSKELQAEFLRNGYKAKHLDSEMSAMDRRDILNWYKETPDAILCNVGILTTGFDAPSTECVILYRATKSLPLFLQMCGRGARIATGKTNFYILDFGNNIAEFGYWEQGRTWSLNKKEKQAGAAPVKECPSCSAILYASAKECTECGYEFQQSEKEKEHVELVELTKEYQDEPKWKILKEAERANLDKLVKMTKAKLIKPFWVLHKCFNHYQEALSYTRALGYKDGFLYHQIKTGNFRNLKQ
jgi:superfamily II DNA or RNA helicase